MTSYSCIRNEASLQPQWVLLKIEEGGRSTRLATFNNKAAAQETATYLNAISLGKWRVHAAVPAIPEAACAAPASALTPTPNPVIAPSMVASRAATAVSAAPRRRVPVTADYIWPVIEQTSAIGVSAPRWASPAM